MSSKTTWFWLCLAAVLLGLIFLHQRFPRRGPAAEPRVLPALNPKLVDSVEVRPGSGAPLQIRAERVTNTWRLTQPLAYPAQAISIDNLLTQLAELKAAAYIPLAELRRRPNAEEEFGLASPKVSLVFQQGSNRLDLLIGALTPPGDQVYVRRGDDEGVFIVDANLIKAIPSTADQWRDTTFVDLEHLAFDRLAITNGPTALVLQREVTNRLWHLVWPNPARADAVRIEDNLRQLQSLRVQSFVSDSPTGDLESFGLAPPELQIALGQGPTNLALLEFGKSPTNDTGCVYARRNGRGPLFTVKKEQQAFWRKPVSDFRDRHLLTVQEAAHLAATVTLIEVQGQDRFSLQRQTNDTWRVAPQDFQADAPAINELIQGLSTLEIVQFTKDVVNAPDLPAYGLSAPARQYTLKAAAGTTNVVMTELLFGSPTNSPGEIFARRNDETSVYAVNPNQFARVPAASWQFRDRKLWNFSEADVAKVTVQRKGKARQLLRNGLYQWSLAEGSQGVIQELPVEETVRGLAQAYAQGWVGCGEAALAPHGLSETNCQVTIELKNGQKAAIEFAEENASGAVYAAVRTDGQPWVMEFPPLLYRDVVVHLASP